jgi:hypothetical protein
MLLYYRFLYIKNQTINKIHQQLNRYHEKSMFTLMFIIYCSLYG